MAKLNYFLLVATFGVAVALPQRNLPYPTTRRPGPGSTTTSAPNNPTTSWTPSTTAWTPSSSSWSPSTTPSEAEASGYPAAGFRPGRAFNLPTEEKKAQEPSSSYGPPADKYGPPEEQTTTIQPELDGSGNNTSSDNTTAKIPKGLEPGFYFIQLPGGGIQKIALLTNAALVQLPTAAEESPSSNDEKNDEDDDAIEPTTTSPSTTQSQHVQSIANTRTFQVWPAVPQVVSVQPVVDVQPVVVESAKLVKPIRSQPLVNVEPVLYIQPKSYSYTSQFRTW